MHTTHRTCNNNCNRNHSIVNVNVTPLYYPHLLSLSRYLIVIIYFIIRKLLFIHCPLSPFYRYHYRYRLCIIVFIIVVVVVAVVVVVVVIVIVGAVSIVIVETSVS